MTIGLNGKSGIEKKKLSFTVFLTGDEFAPKTQKTQPHVVGITRENFGFGKCFGQRKLSMFWVNIFYSFSVHFHRVFSIIKVFLTGYVQLPLVLTNHRSLFRSLEVHQVSDVCDTFLGFYNICNGAILTQPSIFKYWIKIIRGRLL